MTIIAPRNDSCEIAKIRAAQPDIDPKVLGSPHKRHSDSSLNSSLRLSSGSKLQVFRDTAAEPADGQLYCALCNKCRQKRRTHLPVALLWLLYLQTYRMGEQGGVIQERRSV